MQQPLALQQQQAFWRLPLMPLKTSCQHFGAHAEDGQDLFAGLLALMSHCLPQASAEAS